jgi:hypothetical protein
MADVGTLRVRGTWNNADDSGLLDAGYVVEYEPVPEPAGLAALALAVGIAALRAR